MSDDFLHHIKFCFHIINTFFDHLVCSSDQCIFGIHDLGAWYFLLGLLQNQSNFIVSFQLIYSLFPQQYIKRNESSIIERFFFKYCRITQTWWNLFLLAFLGNPSEYNNCNFARGSSNEIFLYWISFTNWRYKPKFCKGFPHVACFFLSRSLQNQSQFNQLKWATKILQGVPPRGFFFVKVTL